MLGAVNERVIRTAPRAQGLFISRAICAATLLRIVASYRLVVAGTQAVTTACETTRFAAMLFPILAPLRFALVNATFTVESR